MGHLAPILQIFVVLLLLTQQGRTMLTPTETQFLSYCPGTALDNITSSSLVSSFPMGQPHIPLDV